eukprot:gene7693-5395_t
MGGILEEATSRAATQREPYLRGDVEIRVVRLSFKVFEVERKGQRQVHRRRGKGSRFTSKEQTAARQMQYPRTNARRCSVSGGGRRCRRSRASDSTALAERRTSDDLVEAQLQRLLASSTGTAAPQLTRIIRFTDYPQVSAGSDDTLQRCKMASIRVVADGRDWKTVDGGSRRCNPFTNKAPNLLSPVELHSMASVKPWETLLDVFVEGETFDEVESSRLRGGRNTRCTHLPKITDFSIFLFNSFVPHVASYKPQVSAFRWSNINGNSFVSFVVFFYSLFRKREQRKDRNRERKEVCISVREMRCLGRKFLLDYLFDSFHAPPLGTKPCYSHPFVSFYSYGCSSSLLFYHAW